MSSAPQRALWVNGRFCGEDEPAIAALDRGFTLGDGLFETMLARAARIFRLAQHLERLRRAAAVLEISLPPEDLLLSALQGVLARIPDVEAIVRLTVTRGPDLGRGVGIASGAAPTVVVRAVPAAPPSADTYARGFHALISSIRRNEGSPLSRIKSCNYGDSILARREAQKKGADEAILLNNRGEVACASTANIFVVSQGRLWTPPEECGVLPGITRACLLELARGLGVPVEVAPFQAVALLGADEAFISNTALGVMPLAAIDGRALGGRRPGPVALRLAAAYDKLVRAELGDAAATP